MSIETAIRSFNNGLPSTVRLVAVSKFKPLEAILEAYGAGQRLFGENRPQELAAKATDPRTPSDIEWHMIGHLQTNKVKMVVPHASMIQSVDTVKLLAAIDSYAASIGKVQDCLLEVHIASEESKQGFSPEEAIELAGSFEQYAHVRMRGVMGMASFVDDEAVVRSEFRTLRRTFDTIKENGRTGGRSWVDSFDTVSMGMSHDYALAIEEGATVVRIGTSIFGSRN